MVVWVVVPPPPLFVSAASTSASGAATSGYPQSMTVGRDNLLGTEISVALACVGFGKQGNPAVAAYTRGGVVLVFFLG